MRIEKLSKKQKEVLKFGHSPKYKNYNSIICDGAVRSGKTAIMTIAFIHWAMRYFQNASFAVCGKTINSAERNVIEKIFSLSDITSYFDVEYLSSKHKLVVKRGENKNCFYVFGGKDKSSYSLIQGITLSGVFFDEVALQNENFVYQAIARTLSQKGSKLWFNCNPEHPEHWFYKDWILDANGENKRRSFHLHFLMNDNPILSKEEIEKANSLYSGVFKQRYILGKWVAAQGLVYPMFSKDLITNKTNYFGDYYISIDYGTINPFSAGLWVISGQKAIRLKEFYFDSKKQNRQLTDEEYYNELLRFSEGYSIKSVIVDPSAASFIQTIRRHKFFTVRKANNDVINGIRLTGNLLKSGKILINESCKDIIREFSLYCWDEESKQDAVKKEYDHAMDELRYFCTTVLQFNKEFSGKITGKNSNYFLNEKELNEYY